MLRSRLGIVISLAFVGGDDARARRIAIAQSVLGPHLSESECRQIADESGELRRLIEALCSNRIAEESH